MALFSLRKNSSFLRKWLPKCEGIVRWIPMSSDIVSHNVNRILLALWLTLWFTLWEDCEKLWAEMNTLIVSDHPFYRILVHKRSVWVPTLSASARHSFFMNGGFEWNVLMIKVIKVSMRSCLSAFGLGKVGPKLEKKFGCRAITIILLQGSVNSIYVQWNLALVNFWVLNTLISKQELMQAWITLYRHSS